MARNMFFSHDVPIRDFLNYIYIVSFFLYIYYIYTLYIVLFFCLIFLGTVINLYYGNQETYDPFRSSLERTASLTNSLVEISGIGNWLKID